MNSYVTACIAEEVQSIANELLKESFPGDEYRAVVELTEECVLTRIRDLKYPSEYHQIGSIELVTLPGCCGVAVSTGKYVYSKYRNEGIGKLLSKINELLARKAGYTVLLCTDVFHNTPQRKILTQNGWEDVFRFVNKRTGNEVCISVKSLVDTDM